jgi:chromosome segregation ATPase
MPILEKTIRLAAIAIAVLFIGLSLFGIFGAWFVDRKATDFALKGFGLVETGVEVVDAGVGRVNDLIATSRMEVRQASETITATGAQAQANAPVLNALNERLETSLAPRIAQMQQVLAPVRDALRNVANAVSLLNSLPMMADRAPRLAALDETFNRLEELSADATQLRGTLRALVAAQQGEVTAQTVATLNGLTRRIDTRLGEVQANVQGVRADIAALQARLDTRKSRLLLAFNLLALLSTLMLIWIVYTQVVVIRHHWTRIQRRAAGPLTNGSKVSSTVTPPT